MGVQFSFKVECPLFVGHVAWRDEQCEADPEEEAVDGEEGAIVEEDAGPTDERRENAESGCDGGNDQLGVVSNTDDIGVVPDVEPDEKAGDKTSERIATELLTLNRDASEVGRAR